MSSKLPIITLVFANKEKKIDEVPELLKTYV